MTQTLIADAVSPRDDVVTMRAAGRGRSLSLQARIALTVGVLAVLMLAIGAIGLAGGYRANRATRDTY